MSDLFVTATPRSLGVLPVGALLLGGTGVSEQADGGPSIAPLPRAVESGPVRPRGQGGFGLVEILVAVLLVGTVVLSLVVGLLFIVRTTHATSELQQLQRTMANLSESVKLLEYPACAELVLVGPADTSDEAVDRYRNDLLSTGVLELGPSGDLVPVDSWRPEIDVVIEVESVEFWQKVVFDGDEPGAGAFVEQCPYLLDSDGDPVLDGSGQPIVTDDGTQLVTVRATSGERSVATQIVTTAR